jgi:hypothetical protein
MKSSKVLEMLHQNRIEELKAELQDEIFTESLKTNPSAKKRYAAMKRYLKSSDSGREILQKPCEVSVDGVKYNAFCNAFTLALTSEPCGEIAMCDEPDRYPDVTRLVNYNGDEGKINVAKILAEAKSKGYSFKKAMMHSNDYLMHYGEAYFRIGLLDLTYSIIDDGTDATVYYAGGSRRPITIQNDIGTCVIMPVFIDGGTEDCVVVEAN